MTHIEVETGGGVLSYELRDKAAYITAHRGIDPELFIPESIQTPDGELVAVKGVGRKAFLSDRYLHRVELPVTIENIGDWAFAGCKRLEVFSMYKSTTLSSRVFKNCNILNQVILRNPEEEWGLTKRDIDVSFLMAAVNLLLDDKHLFSPQRAGDDDWLKHWDMRMELLLNEPDEEGYSLMLACGEEEYDGKDNTIEHYLNMRRSRKVRICLVRLKYDSLLSDEKRQMLQTYLYEHRAGTSSPETWQVVLEEHGDEEDYYRIIHECGCITSENLEIMLSDMGERHARMKAYILRLATPNEDDDFFSQMEL